MTNQHVYASYPLGLNADNFPVKAKALRRIVATIHERCPECGGFLDTGYECNDCGFDAAPEVKKSI